MKPADVITLLDQAPPFRPRAVEILGELSALERAGELSSAALADRQPEIAAALKALEHYLVDIKQVTERCTQLLAIPSSHVPPGF